MEFTDTYKIPNIIGGSVACHSNRTKRVDRGLKQNIRKINDRALDSGWNTDLEYLLYIARFHT